MSQSGSVTIIAGGTQSVVISLQGPPGPAGASGASTAAAVSYDDSVTQFGGVTTLQQAIVFLAALLGYPIASGGGPIFDFSQPGNFSVGMIMGVI